MCEKKNVFAIETQGMAPQHQKSYLSPKNKVLFSGIIFSLSGSGRGHGRGRCRGRGKIK